MLSVDEVNVESFQIKAASEGELLALRLSGTGDMVAVDPLKKCLEQARASLKSRIFTKLRVDIRSLYLLNSSCIKTMVHFIYLNMDEGPGSSIEFIVDEKVTWQARALAALKRLSPKHVTITSMAN
jgi:hypothetical protein